MPTPERPGGQEKKEDEPIPYYQVDRFRAERTAGRVLHRPKTLTARFVARFLAEKQ